LHKGFKWLFTDCIILFLWFFFFLLVPDCSKEPAGFKEKAPAAGVGGQVQKSAMQWSGLRLAVGRDYAGGARVAQVTTEARRQLWLLLATRVWRYFCLWPVRKNSDRPAARCDPQARIKWAAVGFLAFDWRHRKARAKNTMELP
jgi:hypothetical protein